MTLKEKFKTLGKKFVNASEFSAQEAVYFVMLMPLFKSSRDCKFINTRPFEKRVRILKSQKELQVLLENSRDVFVHSLLDNYDD